MGNKTTKTTLTNNNSVDGVYINKENINQLNSSLNISLRGHSFSSINSLQSNYSVSRPWSRLARRRWNESTLTLPYETSKTNWPLTQLELCFLPEFPLSTTQNNEKKFNYLNEIGKGAYGKVYKVNDNKKEKVYALKVLSKSKIIKEKAIQQVKDEVQIQKVCGHHPFIVNCPFHWQSRKRLFIVTDYVAGEFFNLLKTYNILSIPLVQLYVAQIALALDFLHNAGIIYRDLKPENILLDNFGNIQLIDFGLSKWLSYGKKTNTICGTIRYIAPEIMACKPYGHAVDWWSLGIITCLMLTGEYPSTDETESETDSSTTTTTTEQKSIIQLPDSVVLDVPSKDLLLRLLEFEPTKRLRTLRNLQTIAFFKGFNFEDVRKKKQNPKDLLDFYFPNGAPKLDEEFNDF